MTKDRPVLTINRTPKKKMDTNFQKTETQSNKTHGAADKPAFSNRYQSDKPKFNRSRVQVNPETLVLKQGIQSLCKMFPSVFNYQAPKPLKVGILDDIFIVVGKRQDKPKSHYKRVLSYYTGTKRYLNSVIDSAHRYDLFGKPVDEITQEHKETAKERLKKLRMKRKTRSKQR